MTVWYSQIARRVTNTDGEPITGVRDVTVETTTDSNGYFTHDFGAGVTILNATALVSDSGVTPTSNINTATRAEIYGINGSVVKGFAVRSRIISISLGVQYSPLQSAGAGIPIRIMCKIQS